jgi:dTDP-4-amino-4,6-dideoxygalactose transaminase
MTSKLSGVARQITGKNVKFLKPAWEQTEMLELSTFLSDPWAYETELSSNKNIFSEGCYEVLTDSGRSAIQLALDSMGFSKGSEVIIPSFACTGVIQPIVNLGLIPVFADVDHQHNISEQSAADCLTSETRAIIVPALGGLAVSGRASIRKFALERNIVFIDDLAQSTHLANKYISEWSTSREIIVFSTGVGKPLFGTSGGGLICSKEMEERIELLRIPHQPVSEIRSRVEQFNKKYLQHSALSEVINLVQSRTSVKSWSGRFNDISPDANSIRSISKFDETIARMQFDHLEEHSLQQQKNADRWFNLFDSFGLSDKLIFVPKEDNLLNKYWVKGASLDTSSIVALRSALWRQGIETENLYRPLHMRSEFKHFSRGSLPMTEQLTGSVFSLPVRANLNLLDWERIEMAFEGILNR